jgi:hypothetical protein
MKQLNLYKNLGLFMGFIVLFVLIFFLGFFFGNRDKELSKPANIQTVFANMFVENSLSDMQNIALKGKLDPEPEKKFGNLHFVERTDKQGNFLQTEILIDIQNFPLKLKGSQGSKNTPDKLEISTATLTDDGTDFVFEKIGEITLEKNNQIKQGRFSTVLKKSVSNKYRQKAPKMLYLTNTNPEFKNFYNFDVKEPNVPNTQKGKEIPYLFVYF